MRALALPHGLALVTISGGGRPPWASLLHWPERGDVDVPLQARTQGERNLLGIRLDAAVTQADRAVLLLADGAGCFATAWWARLSPASYVARVAGAIFFQPAESGEGDVHQVFASPHVRLPFPSVMIGTSASRAATRTDLHTLAEGWGSRVLGTGGTRAHGAFERTRRAIARFTAAVVERDLDTAARLAGRREATSPLRLLRRQP